MAECAFRNKLKVSRPLLDSDLPEECGSRTIETLEYPHKTRTLKGRIGKLAKEELAQRDYGDTQTRYRTEDVAKRTSSVPSDTLIKITELTYEKFDNCIPEWLSCRC